MTKVPKKAQEQKTAETFGLSPQRIEEAIFTKPDTLQFRCKSCPARVTWSRYRTGGYSDPLIDRTNCQGRMMTGRCPKCRQMYGKRLSHAQCVPNELLEKRLPLEVQP